MKVIDHTSLWTTDGVGPDDGDYLPPGPVGSQCETYVGVDYCGLALPYVCTRELGHGGPHAAHTTDDRQLMTWEVGVAEVKLEQDGGYEVSSEVTVDWWVGVDGDTGEEQ